MKQRQYIDFKLYLTRTPDGTGCQVTLLPTPEVGETIMPVIVPAEKGPRPNSWLIWQAKALPCGNWSSLARDWQIGCCLRSRPTIKRQSGIYLWKPRSGPATKGECVCA